MSSRAKLRVFLIFVAIGVVSGMGSAYLLYYPKDNPSIGAVLADVESISPTSTEYVPTPAEDILILEMLGPDDDARYEIEERLDFIWCWPEPLRPDEKFAFYLKSDSYEMELNDFAVLHDHNCYEFAALALDIVELPGTYSWQIRIYNRNSNSIVAESEFRDINLLWDGSFNTPTRTPSPTITLTGTATQAATHTSTSTRRPSSTATATKTPSPTSRPSTFTPTATPVSPTSPPPQPPTSPPPTSPPPTSPPPPTPTAPLPTNPTATPPVREPKSTSAYEIVI